jgi:signal transduction histidine kinase
VLDKVPGDFLQGPETSEQAVEEMRNALRTKQGFDVEIVNYSKDGTPYWLAIEVRPITDSSGQVTHFIAVESDITHKKQAAEERERLQDELVNASHLAGMAELATGVLHNAGNVLNSINVSANLIVSSLASSSISSVGAASRLLEEHKDELADFMTNQRKGQLFPDYLDALASKLDNERTEVTQEMRSLVKNVEHVKEIISVQQNYARVVAVQQEFDVCGLIDDAIIAADAAIERHGIQVIKEFASCPNACTDKHKLLQILVNLISNAKAAVLEHNPEEAKIHLSLQEQDGVAIIDVTDNGVGISTENMSRLFRHGFSTKRTGHGFGLHSSAINAKAIGGELSANSEGLGKGATFRLSFPLEMNATSTEPSPALASV